MKRMLLAAVLGTAVLSAGSGSVFSADDAVAIPPATDVQPAKKAKVALIALSGALAERPESFSLSMLLNSGKTPALSDLIQTLNAAAKDSSLSGVVLDFSSFSLTLNESQEIGGLLANLRKSGKRVAIYTSDFDTPTYVLASYADTIIMPESGDVLIPGAGMEMVFFAGTLEKLHMSADFVQIGKFKGAEEPFTRTSASPEYKGQIEKLVDGMYQQVVSMIAANRPNLTDDQVKKAIDAGWMSGKQAKDAGLVDQTMTRDKLEGWINDQFPAGASVVTDYAQPEKKDIDLDSPLAIFSLLGASDKPKAHGPAVAVIFANGDIGEDSGGVEDPTGGITPGGIRDAVNSALDDKNVKAIVLRVDSPGGSAAASDEIWSILKSADKKKPVTISMGEFAASGGYYISCAGRSIMADPATITGSIGVVGGKVVIKGALDWAGINIEPVVKGAHAEMLSMLRPFTDEERAYVQKSMEDVYGTFTDRVKAARGSKIANLDDVDQGRLFTGMQAKEAGLVDDVGTLNDAVKAAAKSQGLGDDYRIDVLPPTKSLSDVLRQGLLGETHAPLTLGGMKTDALSAMVRSLPEKLQAPTLQAMGMLQKMQNERVLLEMPPGLMETGGR